MYLKSFIIFINVAIAMGVLYLATVNYRPESMFDVGIYTLSVLFDIADLCHVGDAHSGIPADQVSLHHLDHFHV